MRREEEKRQQGIQLRHKGGEIPKIDACLFFFFVAPNTPNAAAQEGKEDTETFKVSKGQSAD